MSSHLILVVMHWQKRIYWYSLLCSPVKALIWCIICFGLNFLPLSLPHTGIFLNEEGVQHASWQSLKRSIRKKKSSIVVNALLFLIFDSGFLEFEKKHKLLWKGCLTDTCQCRAVTFHLCPSYSLSKPFCLCWGCVRLFKSSSSILLFCLNFPFSPAEFSPPVTPWQVPTRTFISVLRCSPTQKTSRRWVNYAYSSTGCEATCSK